jgi:hypothetical protein
MSGGIQMAFNDYTEINTQMDIDVLMNLYGGFHDAVIIDANFKSGCYVDENLCMGFGDEQSRELVLRLHRQWKPANIEMRFTGVRRVHIVGFMDNYLPDILVCHLAFHNDLLIGCDEPLIVWSDNDGSKRIDTINTQKDLLQEPMISYVIARKLKYKIG